MSCVCVQEIVDLDPCHKFTWCLDACIRERTVDNKRGRELQGFLDSIRKGNEQVTGRRVTGRALQCLGSSHIEP